MTYFGAHQIRHLAPSLFLCCSLVACSNNGGGASSDESTVTVPISQAIDPTHQTYDERDPLCALPEMRSWVDDNMRDYYLFYDQVPTVNLSDYTSVETLIEGLRVQPYDRFSYIGDNEQYESLFEEGIRFGFGMWLARTSDSSVQFTMIDPDSPMDMQGIQRGDYFLAINGIDINQITNEQLDEAFGIGDEVVSPTFTVADSDGRSRDITITKASYKVATVIEHSVNTHNNQKVGYLNLTSFLQTTEEELDEAFVEFKSNQIDELVLDFRYNGGGRIGVAGTLASRILGAAGIDNDFLKVKRNNKYTDTNETLPFSNEVNALNNLSRVFVLTTSRTCSASELVMNGLKPFMEVISVGTTSCGKPYGTLGDVRCGKVMHALRYGFENANNVGDYYDGLNADCTAYDNPSAAFRSNEDGMYQTAIHYMSSGSCDNTTTTLAARNAQRSLELMPRITTTSILDEARELRR